MEDHRSYSGIVRVAQFLQVYGVVDEAYRVEIEVDPYVTIALATIADDIAESADVGRPPARLATGMQHGWHRVVEEVVVVVIVDIFRISPSRSRPLGECENPWKRGVLPDQAAELGRHTRKGVEDVGIVWCHRGDEQKELL